MPLMPRDSFNIINIFLQPHTFGIRLCLSFNVNIYMSLDYIKRSFQKWTAELDQVNYLPLEKSLALYKKSHIEFPRIISAHLDYPLKIYRARIIATNSNEDISNPQTFSYPPKEKAISYQRANVPGFPVFYGAMDGKTALEELRTYSNQPITKGDQVYLSEWRFKPDSKYILNYLTLSHIKGEQHLYSDITQNVETQFERIFQNETIAFKQKQKFLFDTVSELFLSGSYLQSGIIAYQILYNTPLVNNLKIDGILYPSCCNNYRSVNCAFLPQFVDTSLELETVRKVSFEEFTTEGANSTSRYFGIVKNNKVIWKTYITELMIRDYKSVLALDDKWPEEDILKSDFFIQDGQMDFAEFCQKRINAIDLSDHRIPQRNEHFYKENGTLVYRLIYQFGQDECTLRYRGKLNNIPQIIIFIPVKTKTKIVSKAVVLQT
ncbi:MAG: hypothetical protein JWP94_588 [Mucilaginibacter sp.]|nr:hypothetical protein [Mucilaginibacter sp.]